MVFYSGVTLPYQFTNQLKQVGTVTDSNGAYRLHVKGCVMENGDIS